MAMDAAVVDRPPGYLAPDDAGYTVEIVSPESGMGNGGDGLPPGAAQMAQTGAPEADEAVQRLLARKQAPSNVPTVPTAPPPATADDAVQRLLARKQGSSLAPVTPGLSVAVPLGLPTPTPTHPGTSLVFPQSPAPSDEPPVPLTDVEGARPPGMPTMDVGSPSSASPQAFAPAEETATDYLPGFEFMAMLPVGVQMRVNQVIPGLLKAGAAAAISTTGTVGGGALGTYASPIVGTTAGAMLGSYGARRLNQALGLEEGEPTWGYQKNLGDALALGGPLIPAVGAVIPLIRKLFPANRAVQKALDTAEAQDVANLATYAGRGGPLDKAQNATLTLNAGKAGDYESALAKAQTGIAEDIQNVLAKNQAAQETYAQAHEAHTAPGGPLTTAQYQHAEQVRNVVQQNLDRQTAYETRLAAAEQKAQDATTTAREAAITKHEGVISGAREAEQQALKNYAKAMWEYRGAIKSQSDAVTTLRDIPPKYGSETLPEVQAALAMPPAARTVGGATEVAADAWRHPDGTLRFALKDTPPAELELQEFIRQQGGLRVVGPELTADFQGLIQQRQSGIYGLINDQSGKSLGDMAELAEQHGFLREANKSELLDALRESTAPNGGAVYSQQTNYDPFAPAGQPLRPARPVLPNASPAQRLYQRVDTEYGDVPIATQHTIKAHIPELRDRLGETPNLEPSGIGTILRTLEALPDDAPLNQIQGLLRNLQPYMRQTNGNVRYVAGQARTLLEDAMEQSMQGSPDAREGVTMLRAARQAYRREAAVDTLTDMLKKAGPVISDNAAGQEVVNAKAAMNLVDRLSDPQRYRFFAGSFAPEELAQLRTEIRGAAQQAKAIPRQVPIEPPSPPMTGPLELPEPTLPKSVPPPRSVALKSRLIVEAPKAPAPPVQTPLPGGMIPDVPPPDLLAFRGKMLPPSDLPTSTPKIAGEPLGVWPALRDVTTGLAGGWYASHPIIGAGLGAAAAGAQYLARQQAERLLAAVMIDPAKRAGLRAIMTQQGTVTLPELAAVSGAGAIATVTGE